MELKESVSAIILAGGNSERMQFPKAFLPIGKLTFLPKIINDYKCAGIGKIIVVMNALFCQNEWAEYYDQFISDIILVKNEKPDLGKLYSLKLGIELIGENELCFMHPVDHPLVKTNTITKLIDGFSGSITSPVFDGKNGHPVLLGKDVISFIKSNNNNNLNLKELFSNFKRNNVEVEDDGVLININNREEYNRFVNQKTEA